MTEQIGREDPMSYSVTMYRQAGGDEATVRYTETERGSGGLLADAVTFRAAVLPDPPPATIRVTFDWIQTRTTEHRTAAERVVPGPPSQGPVAGGFKPGAMVKVVKSRVSGVKNPPEWLEQHLGKIGVVLWTTAGGANVDLGGEAVWFAYDELELQPA
jgi:hypothetical protein